MRCNTTYFPRKFNIQLESCEPDCWLELASDCRPLTKIRRTISHSFVWNGPSIWLLLWRRSVAGQKPLIYIRRESEDSSDHVSNQESCDHEMHKSHPPRIPSHPLPSPPTIEIPKLPRNPHKFTFHNMTPPKYPPLDIIVIVSSSGITCKAYRRPYQSEQIINI